MPEKSRLTTALRASARAYLDDLTDEPGEYLSDLIEEHYTDLLAARSIVSAAKWTRGEVLSCCDATNGWWLTSHEISGQALALELHDYARLSGLRDDLGADADEWARRVKEVARSQELASALLTLSRAWWRGARIVEQWIDALPRKRTE